MTEWSVTDLVLFGDCRPLHAAAIALSKPRDVRVHVFEEGYLRPNWITLERDGVNARSALPKNPEKYRERADALAPWDGGHPVAGSFTDRAIDACLYHAASVLLFPFYPNYETHRPWHPVHELTGWLRKLARSRGRARSATALVARLIESKAAFYVHPLQLDSDAQIRHHFELKAVGPAMEMVIASFARTAPAATILVIKEHPLDNGLKDWRTEMQRCARRFGVEDRVIYIAGGDLETLLQGAKGVATVNSTVGLIALSLCIPVIALGHAVYAMPGLTHCGPIDGFWNDPQKPCPELFDAFRRLVAQETQINGGYFDRAAIEMAVEAVVQRWNCGTVRLEAEALQRSPAFVDANALSLAC